MFAYHLAVETRTVSMNSYSQNGEDKFILNYFGKFKGTLCEIGANDGVTLSNSKLLIEHGWCAHLLEPGGICADLFLLHKDNSNVHVYNYGIGETEQIVTFYESGAHISGGIDKGLVSTCDYDETLRWRKNGVEFTETNIQLVPYDKFLEYVDYTVFDFISIDAESYDLLILKQINLSLTSCVCIEYNGDPSLEFDMVVYCANFGLKLSHKNNENLLFIR